VGATESRFSASAPVSDLVKTATDAQAYAESNGFLRLLSDGERLTGAYALGPGPGEGSSRRRWPSAPACRSTRCATRSSRIPPPSRRSTPRRSRACARLSASPSERDPDERPGSWSRLRRPVGAALIAATVLASMVGFLDAYVVTVAVPAIGRDLGAGLAGLQWTLTATW
jgi:hypothetical protein